MKTTVVIKTYRTLATSPRVAHRTSLDADRELSHIQRVISAVRSASVPFPIGVCYWKERLFELRSTYVLLPVQRVRLSALEIRLEKIAQEQDGTETHYERRVA
jgi:hypothetical protein